jgi:hypothetical protein
MNSVKRLVMGLVVAGMFLGTGANLPRVSAQSSEDQQLRQLYDDDNLFQQLSGAAQTMLEAKFGRKDASQAEPTAEGTASVLESSVQRHSYGEDSSGYLGNILVNDPNLDTTAQDTQSETTIVLGSGDVVCAGYNDSGSFTFPPNDDDKFTGFSRSTNDGATWTDQGTLPTNANGDAGDPVLARSSLFGTIFFSTLQFSGSGIRVFRSNDDCATFTPPVQGAPGKSGFQDKEWIAVDNFSGAGSGNVYLVARDFGAGNGIYFFRSTDNGATFAPSGGTLIVSGAANNVQGAYVTVGPDHAVYVFFFDQSSPQRIRMRKSTDRGLTFGATVTVATLATTATNGNLGLGGFRTNSFPQAVVNPVNGNQIFAVFNDNPAGTDRADVFLTGSGDGGLTWAAPVRVNNDATTRDQWQPTLAVTPNGERLFISFLDRRLDAANSLMDTFGVIGSISSGTVTFEPNFRITDASFPAVFGQDPAVNPVYMGDYDQAVADNNAFYVTWGDNRLANPNFSAHTNQPDVRFAKIPTTISVILDIKPGAFPNSINTTSKGVIPVAILSTATFDATTVDPASVTFGPGAATEAHGTGHIEDVNGDSRSDLVLHFGTPASGLTAGDTEACVDGTTFSGTPIHDCDSIRTVK